MEKNKCNCEAYKENCEICYPVEVPWNDYMNDLSDKIEILPNRNPDFAEHTNGDVVSDFEKPWVNKEYECPLCEAGHIPTTITEGPLDAVRIGDGKGIAIMGRGMGKTTLLEAHLEDQSKYVLVIGASVNEGYDIAVQIANVLKDVPLIVHYKDDPKLSGSIMLHVPEMEPIDIASMCSDRYRLDSIPRVVDSLHKMEVSFCSTEINIIKYVNAMTPIHFEDTKASNKSYHKFLPHVRGNKHKKKGKG